MNKQGWVAVLAILFFTQPATASIIQLTSRLMTDNVIEGDHATFNVSIVNTGDEPAYNVMLSLLLPDGFSSTPLTPNILNPNQPFEGKFEVDIRGDVAAGMHPLVLLTNYADANSYPFSTVSARTMIIRQAAPIKVIGSLSQAEISGDERGTLKLRILNTDDKPHTVNIRLYLPQELKASEVTKTIDVASNQEANAEFMVSSFGALGGSSYAVFVVLTYVEDNLAHSAIAGNIVRVAGGAPTTPAANNQGASQSGESGSSSIILYALTASLIALIAASLLSRNKK